MLSYPCEVAWVRFPLLSSPLDGMGFVIVAVLSPSATNLATVAGAATLVGPEQPREKSSIVPHRDVCRWNSSASIIPITSSHHLLASVSLTWVHYSIAPSERLSSTDSQRFGSPVASLPLSLSVYAAAARGSYRILHR